MNRAIFLPKQTKITQDYQISKSILGTGISGKVLKCVCVRTGKAYALKILVDCPKSRREAELHWRASDCPNVVRIVDVYENFNQHTRKKYLLLVMECMEGGELFDRIKSRSSFTEAEAAKIVHQIASAVAYLHNKSIAHRDLKPENLLFTSEAPDALLKLTDFGFACEVIAANSLKTPCYTPYYVAPEILTKMSYDQSCDLWSLGIITYILLCGFPPFYSRNGAPISPRMQENIIYGNYDFPESHWANVSSGAKDLIRRLLMTEPSKRLSSAEVMQHPWVAQHTSVPKTPLVTPRFLASTVWDHLNDVMTEELRGMRQDTDNVPILMPIEHSRNPLLTKRTKRNIDLPVTTSGHFNSLRPQQGQSSSTDF